jgi:hypothetical protein
LQSEFPGRKLHRSSNRDRLTFLPLGGEELNKLRRRRELRALAVLPEGGRFLPKPYRPEQIVATLRELTTA